MRALVVLPTYQEAGNVAAVLRGIRSECPQLDILVVDDDSPDGTAELAEKVAADLGSIEVLRREGKSGLGAAYRAGFTWGLHRGYDALVEMDADLSHDPADLLRLVDALGADPVGADLAGADLVIGSRYVAGGAIPRWTWFRRMLSRQGNRYASFMLGLPLADTTSGYRVIRAEMLAKIDLDAVRADGYGFQIELVRAIFHAGGRITELPITFSDRREGHSKMSSRIVLEAMVLVTRWGITERFERLRRSGRPPAVA